MSLGCKDLVKDGKWLVPVDERPAGWEKYGAGEPPQSLVDEMIQVAETEAARWSRMAEGVSEFREAIRKRDGRYRGTSLHLRRQARVSCGPVAIMVRSPINFLLFRSEFD